MTNAAETQYLAKDDNPPWQVHVHYATIFSCLCLFVVSLFTSVTSFFVVSNFFFPLPIGQYVVRTAQLRSILRVFDTLNVFISGPFHAQLAHSTLSYVLPVPLEKKESLSRSGIKRIAAPRHSSHHHRQ